MTVQVSISDWLKLLYEAHKWSLIPNRYNTLKLGIWMMQSPTRSTAIVIARSPRLAPPAVCGRTLDDQFDDYLRRLQRQLQKTIAGGLRVTDIYFEGGGPLSIPDWFRDWCTQMGIRIHIINPNELPNELPDRE